MPSEVRLLEFQTCAFLSVHPDYDPSDPRANELVSSLCSSIESVFQHLYRAGVRNYLNICVTPLDILAAEIIGTLTKRMHFRKSRLILVLAEDATQAKLSNQFQRRFRRLLHKSAQVITLPSQEQCQQYLLANAHYMVAVYGDTWPQSSALSEPIQAAHLQKLPLYRIHPDTAEIETPDYARI